MESHIQYITSPTKSSSKPIKRKARVVLEGWTLYGAAAFVAIDLVRVAFGLIK